MGRKPKTIYAVDSYGQLFIKTKYCGIHPLVFYCDGVSITMFKGDKHIYVKVKTLIDNYGEEVSKEILAIWKQALCNFEEKKGELP
jgi:hypothetical protein